MLTVYNAGQDKELIPTMCLVTRDSIFDRKIQLQKVAYSVRRIHAPNITTTSAHTLPVGL